MIAGVVFDLDGTLFEGYYDWPAIKRRLGLPKKQVTILDYLESLPPKKRQAKEQLLEQFEHDATRNGHLKPGAKELLQSLQETGLKLGLATNNTRKNADWILERNDLRFDCVLTRDSGVYKPSAEPLLRVAHALGLEPSELVSVGDNEFDLLAGREAGMAIVVIINSDVDRFKEHCDYALSGLSELQTVLDNLRS